MNSFTNKDVEYVKSLLNYRYRGCEVKVFHKFSYVRFFLSEMKSAPLYTIFKEFIKCLKDKPNGVYSHYTKMSYVFPKVIYNKIDDDLKHYHKMLCGDVLIHELRHYFQHNYMNTDKWSEERIEKDATKFEMKMFLKNYDELNKLNT